MSYSQKNLNKNSFAKSKSSKPRLQLNIRLTAKQAELLAHKIELTQKTKTEFIIDCIEQTPIYSIPELAELLRSIKYLGNETANLQRKLSEINMDSTIDVEASVKKLQKGCDEIWRLLSLLKQGKVN